MKTTYVFKINFVNLNLNVILFRKIQVLVSGDILTPDVSFYIRVAKIFLGINLVRKRRKGKNCNRDNFQKGGNLRRF